MNYYWMIVNDTSGDIGKSSCPIPPDSSMAQPGFSIVGPYDDGQNPMPTDFQTAYENPQAWLYQGGAYVSNPNYAFIQLAQAKRTQLAYLTQSLEKAIAAGFPSSASGTSDTYAIDLVSMGKWTGTLANINAGNVTTNIIVKDISGAKVTLTPTQFKQFALDGFNYYNTQEQNLWTKEADVESATTIVAVQAVTW